jgi:hypothetical protein
MSILDAAFDLVSEQGPGNVRIDEILDIVWMSIRSG